MQKLTKYVILNRTREIVIADYVENADCVWARARGLIGRREIPNGFGLVIRPCNAIHTLFMSMDLDAIHVDSGGRVVRILHQIKPWRVGPIVWKSASVIELPAGTARATGTQVGDLVELVERSGNERSFSSGRLPAPARGDGRQLRSAPASTPDMSLASLFDGKPAGFDGLDCCSIDHRKCEDRTGSS